MEHMQQLEELDSLIDERLVVMKTKFITGYDNVLEQWKDSLVKARELFQTRYEEFNQFADTICAQYSQLPEAIHDHNYTTKKKNYVPHNCDQTCWKSTSVDDWYKFSPLSIPIKLGWQRVVMQRSAEAHLDVYYEAPCGRRLRSMEEIQQFLEITGVTCVEITQFTFDPQCSVQSEPFNPKEARACAFFPDFSFGQEKRPFSCVNSVNCGVPEPFQYITQRTHEPEIQLHTERPFLVSCECTDNCTNRSNCDCWQLTIQESKSIGQTQHSVGYVHKRLKREQHSAIYECNEWCSCGPQCANRVVQNGLQHRLQVFRTQKTGWGLRTLDDIPKGSFICTYIGHIYTEEGGEEHATRYGDEYFAELDYIEVMEHHKEGYESDVDERMSGCSSPSSDQGSVYSIESTGPMKLRLKKSSVGEGTLASPITVLSSDEEDGDHSIVTPSTPALSSINSFTTSIPSPINLNSTQDQVVTQHPRFSPRLSPMKAQGMRTRKYFHEEFSYIMDAKERGNLGRYINHSCSPNLFVQNVFIDTHDLRFPWVAFFSRRRIKSYQELTWDYHYEVGSVDGKQIQCQCGASNCRGRLL